LFSVWCLFLCMFLIVPVFFFFVLYSLFFICLLHSSFFIYSFSYFLTSLILKIPFSERKHYRQGPLVSCHFSCPLSHCYFFCYSRSASILCLITLPVFCSFSLFPPDLTPVIVGLLGIAYGSFRLHVNIYYLWFTFVPVLLDFPVPLPCLFASASSFSFFTYQLPTPFFVPNIFGLHAFLGYGCGYFCSWFVPWWLFCLGCSFSYTITFSCLLYLFFHCWLLFHL